MNAVIGCVMLIPFSYLCVNIIVNFPDLKKLYWGIYECNKMKQSTEHNIKQYNSYNKITCHFHASIKTILIIIQLKVKTIRKILLEPNILKRNLIVLPYSINGTNYKAIILHKEYPRKIIRIINTDDIHETDVTKQLLPYMGPQENFYGHTVQPCYFGFKKLRFDYSYNNTIMSISFNPTENICYDIWQ